MRTSDPDFDDSIADSPSENVHRCDHCGRAQFDALVQYGSYFLRCQHCREIDAATSWMAVGPEWTARVRVFRDGDTDRIPILEGIGRELWDRIQELAADGTTLLLLGDVDAKDNP